MPMLSPEPHGLSSAKATWSRRPRFTVGGIAAGCEGLSAGRPEDSGRRCLRTERRRGAENVGGRALAAIRRLEEHWLPGRQGAARETRAGGGVFAPWPDGDRGTLTRA